MTKLTMKSLVVYIVATAAVWAQSQPQDSSKSAAVFKQLKSLLGEWEAVQEGVPVKETYTLTANGSVLMSETKPADSEPMITMFTVDGDHLIATHYCSAKNQPQMITSALTDVQKPLAFSLARVTGLKSPDDWHNTGLTVIQEDNDHLTQEWTYESKGKSGKRIFRYTRVRS